AAGLLGGEGVVPWVEEALPGASEEALPVAGAPSGGVGLTGAGAVLPDAEGASPSAESGAGGAWAPVPMMPGTGSSGAGAGTASGDGRERPDSSGLLDAAASWVPQMSVDTGEELGSAAGAVAGGAALYGLTEAGPAPAFAAPVGERSADGASTTPGTDHDRHAGMGPAYATAGEPVVPAAEESPEAPGALPDDRVPVVAQHEDTEDVSAWDLAAAGFAPLLLSLAGRATADESAEEVGSSRYTVTDPAIWDAEEGTAARLAERTVAPYPGASTAYADGPELTTWRPAQRTAQAPSGVAFVEAEEVRCGNGDGDPGDEPDSATVSPDESEGDPEEENTEEEGVVQLLRQDTSTWGTRSDAMPDSLG
ncbi:hypothetical protein ACFWBB_10515, partial [Streptomyces sp. NPDC060000]|uniref:hypothetical protein n=1 Tax=Streptomyces sp. NPDC060000 TaxID=3347031 RepID=UPI0036A11E0A